MSFFLFQPFNCKSFIMVKLNNMIVRHNIQTVTADSESHTSKVTLKTVKLDTDWIFFLFFVLLTPELLFSHFVLSMFGTKKTSHNVKKNTDIFVSSLQNRPRSQHTPENCCFHWDGGTTEQTRSLKWSFFFLKTWHWGWLLWFWWNKRCISLLVYSSVWTKPHSLNES